MYYLWALLASIVFFSAIQYNEYAKLVDKRSYNPLTLANIGTFVILYMILLIMIYMISEQTSSNSHNSFPKMRGGGVDKIKSSIDPNMLRKISDNIYTGFSPNMKSDI